MRLSHSFLPLLLATAALAAPPRVLTSTVEDGQDDADPALTEVRVTFDQPMAPASWSIVGGGPLFPKVTTKPRWADASTIVIPVALEPDHDYWLSVNSDTFTGFRNPAGEPARPQPLAFRTRGPLAISGPPLTDAQKTQAIAALKDAIDNDYAHRDRLQVDWPKAFADAEPKLRSATTANQFARAVAALLRPADDAHVNVLAGPRAIATAYNAVPPNYNIAILKNVLADIQDHGQQVSSAKLPNDVGYLLIARWDAADEKDLDAAFDRVRTSKALVIDVRPNGGGDELAAQRFAARFLDAPRAYSRNRNLRAGQWSGPFDRTLAPRPPEDRYAGPVAVLIGPKDMSSNESFILMMRQSANRRLVGARTRGSSGNPKPHDLGLGVTVLLPSWQDQLPDGTDLEGKGITPDVDVPTTPNDFRQSDPVIAAALKAFP